MNARLRRYPFVLLFVAVSSFSIGIIAAPTGSNSRAAHVSNSRIISSTDRRHISAAIEARADANDNLLGFNGTISDFDNESEAYDIAPRAFEPPEGMSQMENINRRDDRAPRRKPAFPLVIMRPKGTQITYGTLETPALGFGTYGMAFLVKDPGWSTHLGQPAVAKWFWNSRSLTEIENLMQVNELLAWGLGSTQLAREHQGLWAIMRRKRGRPLRKLVSYIQARSESTEVCKKYMAGARKFIVDEHVQKYLKMKGGPSNGDLRQANVNFVEEELADKTFGLVEANVFDWGMIRWHGTKDVFPLPEDIKTYGIDIMEELESGHKWNAELRGGRKKPHYWDFSDDNNCFMWDDAKVSPDPNVAGGADNG